MKYFAFYLPQFHEIPENNEWWGKGFTEWTKVKEAKPIFKGHSQPMLPLNDNFYNLLDTDTVIWQTNLMKKYGVDGLIYYHYYFKGKKLLEKPAENLLSNKFIDQPFFFCWANHSWYRSWEGSKEILLNQTYGNKYDWENHFQYLLPFFKDTRYEKKDNYPLFMLFDCSFDAKEEMMLYFDRRCKEEGFGGIYLIETYNGIGNISSFDKLTSSVTKKIFFRESSASNHIFLDKIKYSPKWFALRISKTLSQKYGKFRPPIYIGNDLYDVIINEEAYGQRYIHGAFFEWDNTPRHKNRGFIITPPSKEKFMFFIEKVRNDDYVFINAWNEWAEGMVLEPTKKNGYKYLSWIKESKERR